jgi:hypothetical protein
MNLFLSYIRSKDDFNAVSEFTTHLESKIKGREPASTVFQDKGIGTGQAWPDVLREKLAAADVIKKRLHPHTMRHYVEFRTMPGRSKTYRSIRPLTAFGLGIIPDCLTSEELLRLA